MGGINLYSYAPNPLTWIDPWGLAKKGKNTKKTSNPISNKIRKAFTDALEDIKNGRGTPRLENDGSPKIYGGREYPKLAGAIEYEVPGLDNNHRILKFEGVDSKGNPYTVYHYTLDHYEKIHSDWSKMEPSSSC